MKRMCRAAVLILAVSALVMGCPTPGGDTSETVPNVVGLSRTDAADAIEAAGLTVGTEAWESSATVPADDVISQNPAAGSRVSAGSAVNLVVSRGIVFRADVNTSATKAAQDGLTWDTAFSTIEAAIAAAAGGGEVWVAQGTYAYDRSGSDSDGSLVMAEGVDLYGGFAGTEEVRDERDWAANETVIDGATARGGSPAYHVVKGADNAVLDGFTVQGGVATDGNDLANTAIDNGAGLYNYGVSPDVANCTFTDNEAAQHGGGIYCNGAASTLTDCTFDANTALLGGGIMSVAGSLTFSGCTFVDNAAQSGGAGYLGTPTAMENCLFTGNTATPDASSRGGAIFMYQSSLRIANSTFNGNTATNGGGALMNFLSTITAANCILWDDTGGEILEITPVYTLVTYSCVDGGYGSSALNNTDEDPLFFATDFRLQAESPCIDTGTDTYAVGATDYDAPGTDIRGETRPAGDGYDMGAYEMVDGDYEE